MVKSYSTQWEKSGETIVIWEIKEGKDSSPMWERWDSNLLHRGFARAGQVMQATVAPLALLEMSLTHSFFA
jgi:hypothetical protein